LWSSPRANVEKAGFYESEIARRTEVFGNIAHVFSTYESRRAKADAPFARGINSIQLLKDGDRWWIVTIFWDAEQPNKPIPPEYLPAKPATSEKAGAEAGKASDVTTRPLGKGELERPSPATSC
jgi:hypothetical protein